jgi:hypothetical protein
VHGGAPAIGLLFEQPDERGADAPPLLLGVRDVLQRGEEPILSGDDVETEPAPGVRRPYPLRLAVPEQPRVDEQRVGSLPNRLLTEQGGDRRVDAAAGRYHGVARDRGSQSRDRFGAERTDVVHGGLAAAGAGGGSSRQRCRYRCRAGTSSG